MLHDWIWTDEASSVSCVREWIRSQTIETCILFCQSSADYLPPSSTLSISKWEKRGIQTRKTPTANPLTASVVTCSGGSTWARWFDGGGMAYWYMWGGAGWRLFCTRSNSWSLGYSSSSSIVISGRCRKYKPSPAAYIDEPFSIDPMIDIAVNKECKVVINKLQAVLLAYLCKYQQLGQPESVGNQFEESPSKRKGRKEEVAMIPHSVMSASRPMGDLSGEASADQSESCLLTSGLYGEILSTS